MSEDKTPEFEKVAEETADAFKGKKSIAEVAQSMTATEARHRLHEFSKQIRAQNHLISNPIDFGGAMADALVYGTSAVRHQAGFYDWDKPTTSPATMHTASGGKLDILAPSQDNIDIGDIAHHLARVSRFTGAIKFPHYSVAQHSVLCSYAARIIAPQLELAALLHDAHEAYIGDISTPMKRAIELSGGRGVIERVEKPIIREIWYKYGHGAQNDQNFVKMIDSWLLWAEAHDVLENAGGSHWRGAFDAMGRLSTSDQDMLCAQLGRITSGWDPRSATASFLETYIDAVKRHRNSTGNEPPRTQTILGSWKEKYELKTDVP